MSDPSVLISQFIAMERLRQRFALEFSDEHDDAYTGNQLALAAAAYLVHGTAAERKKGVAIPSGSDFDVRTIPEIWPRDWEPVWFKPTDRRRNLVKAGALIIAEIERIDRAAVRSATDPGVRVGDRGEIIFTDDEGGGP
ncbi:hypothetical protein [Roseibium album]|uniref:hypothetical protein n=1 Tax=Roseibium album TaxID=311410 RepID=UPI00248F8A1B|nr:hypothetical protein [Roseibium album]